MTTRTGARACDGCVRRSWLLAHLGGHLQHHRRRIGELLALSDDELIEAVGGRAASEIRAAFAAFDAAALHRRVEGARLETLCRCGPDYPRPLCDLDAPPAVLYVAGGRERFAALLEGDPVAIVGSRRASDYGLEVGRQLGRSLATSGVTVISGMAFGIDSAAHEGVLEVSDPEGQAPTVAVLPGSAARAYPRAKRHLHRRLVAAGVAVSELPPGTRVWRWAFPARNRIIAALAAVTVVVEAGTRSGSLVTADFAQQLGRTVGAVPGRVTAAQAAGANDLLARGALVIRDAQDVLDALYGAGAAVAARAVRAPPAAPLASLLSGLAAGEEAASAIRSAGLDPQSGVAALAELELEGWVRRGAGGGYTVLP
jgi:DNA processing protein